MGVPSTFTVTLRARDAGERVSAAFTEALSGSTVPWTATPAADADVGLLPPQPPAATARAAMAAHCISIRHFMVSLLPDGIETSVPTSSAQGL
jgi:hypothetical protein